MVRENRPKFHRPDVYLVSNSIGYWREYHSFRQFFQYFFEILVTDPIFTSLMR